VTCSQPATSAAVTLQASREKDQAAAERAQAAGLAVRASRLDRQGLPVGTRAPDFRLPDLTGKPHSLATFRGRRVPLVFSDPNCAPCQTLAPQLARLQERQRDQLQVVMVSRGELSDNRPKAREHELTFPVLLQKGWQVSKDYAMFATPVAYLIDDHGVIAEDVAVGSDAILQLGQPVAA
jgi:peroxiredoxin